MTSSHSCSRFVAVVFLLVSTAHAAVAGEEGLVTHLVVDRDSTTIVRDVSGNDNAAVIHGARLVVTGEGRALAFDGEDDYLEMADTPGLRSQTFSFEMWVKAESGALISRYFSEVRSSYILQVHSSGRKLYCNVLDRDGTTEWWVETRELDIRDRWLHVVFTCDGRWVRLYIDGEQETFVPAGKLPVLAAPAIPYAEGRPLCIGRSYYASKWSYLKGEIAGFRAYGRALDEPEVDAHFRQGNGVLPGGSVETALRRRAVSRSVKRTARSAPAGAGDVLYLVRDAKPVSTIVVPVQTKYWTKEAVRWLREYVAKATGVDLPVVTEDRAPSGTLISVGETELARKADVSLEDVKWDGCRLELKGDVLFLIGRELKDAMQDPAKKVSDGNCRAVVTFLEDHCGVRWFLPGPAGELIPGSRDIRVPRSLAKTFVPAFAYSDGRFPFGTEGLWLDNVTPAAIANNYRRGIAATAGGHSYYAMVSEAEYFAEHPEYFAMIDGKRSGKGNHLCSTNPDVKKLLLRGMQEAFDSGLDVATLGQEDGYYRCQCTECEKLDDYRFAGSGRTWRDFQDFVLRDTPCERLFLLHKWVIDEVHKTHPAGIVLLMAYAPTAWPSKIVDSWGEHVWIELMNQGPEYVEAWRGKGAGTTGYVYWFNIQLPMGVDVDATPSEVGRRMRYLHENGFLGLYHCLEMGFGFQGPVVYVHGKLMGDPYLDPQSLVEEYVNGVFGRAAPAMQEFFDLLYATHEERFPHRLHGRKWPKWLTTSDLYLMLYPPETLDRLGGLLRRAERDADTERSRGWLRSTRDHFDFTRLLTEAVRAYRLYQRDKTEEKWLHLKRRVEAFDAYRARILSYDSEYEMRWFPGHRHFCNWLTGDTQHESKVYYVPWEKRRAHVLRRGVKGVAIGYGGGLAGVASGYSYVREPLTLDFSGDGARKGEDD